MTKGRFVPPSTVCDVDGRIVRFALCVQLSPSPITATKVNAALPFVIPSELRISYYAALINDHVCGFL
jgi:hypothetical protein